MKPEDRETLVTAVAPVVELALTRIDAGECPILLSPYMEIRSGEVMYSSTVEVDVALHTWRCIGDLGPDRSADAVRVLAHECGLKWMTELMGRDPAEWQQSRASAAFAGVATEVVKACHAGAGFDSAAGNALDRFERFAAIQDAVWTAKIPVTGVSALDRYQLADNILIRPADDDFKTALWAAHGPGAGLVSSLSHDDVSPVRSFDSVIEITRITDRDGWPASPALTEEMHRTLTALRVFGTRRLVAPLLWVHGPPEIEDFGRRRSSTIYPDRAALERVMPTRSPLAIDEPTARDLRHWIDSLRDRPTDDALMFAVQRFNLCDERVNNDDRLVDAWIALEALFSTRRERGGIAYRTALRLALFLGESAEERRSIRDFVRLSYGLRSEVVHGTPLDRRDKRYVEGGDITGRTEDLLRRSLRRWVHGKLADPGTVVSRLETQALESPPLIDPPGKN